MGRLARWRGVGSWGVALMLIAAPSLADDAGALTVIFEGLEHDKGQVYAELFDSEAALPKVPNASPMGEMRRSELQQPPAA